MWQRADPFLDGCSCGVLGLPNKLETGPHDIERGNLQGECDTLERTAKGAQPRQVIS